MTAASGGALGVEHPQRVAGERLAALGAEGVEVGLEVGPQRLDVAGPVGGLAERVEQQRHLAQAEGLVEAPAEGDDLDVEVRVVDAEHLDADLVELPVAAPLRLLVAEVRARRTTPSTASSGGAGRTPGTRWPSARDAARRGGRRGR